MYLYKDGQRVNADKDQVQLMLSSGWSETDEPAVEKASEESDAPAENTVPAENVASAAKIIPKKLIKKG